MTCPGHIPPLQHLKGLPPTVHGSREEKLHYRTRLFYNYNNFFSDLNIFYLFVFWTLAYMYFYFFFGGRTYTPNILIRSYRINLIIQNKIFEYVEY